MVPERGDGERHDSERPAIHVHRPAELDEVLRVSPNWLEAMLLRGLAAYLAGDLDTAKSVWDDASKRHPDEPRLETYRSMLARRVSERS